MEQRSTTQATEQATTDAARRTAPRRDGRRRAAVCGMALAALLTAGCAAEEAGESGGTASEESSDGTASAGETSASASASAGASAGAEGVSVEQVGPEPYGLTTAARPEGEAEPVSGELIVGPGAHLALVSGDQPQVLVFGDDAEFTLRGDRPSVTDAGLGTLEVGRQVELSAVEVPISALEGAPAERLQGAAETALVVVAE